MQPTYMTAQQAFEVLTNKILSEGARVGNTLALFNCGFYITAPTDRWILTPWRKWSDKYAEREWEWYLSADRKVTEIKKYAPIWDRMHSGDDIVNSNYGWQWGRNNQLDYVIDELKRDRNTRRAFLTIFDGKDHADYRHDTPCTLSVGFDLYDGKLNMTVIMRSNDLWYGFCNDQYCFSRLQEYVANVLDIPVGTYYHFAANMHLYDDQIAMLEPEVIRLNNDVQIKRNRR